MISTQAGGHKLAVLDHRHEVGRIGHARVLLRRVCVVPLGRVQVDTVQAFLDLFAARALAGDGVEHERCRQHAVPGELRRIVVVGSLERPGEIVDELLEFIAGWQ